MLFFFYIFSLLNLCIKAEVCSIITISDSDDIVINKDNPFVGFDKSFFSGYNGCYDRDTLDGYIIYFRNPDDCLLYTSPSPRDQRGSRMPSSA